MQGNKKCMDGFSDSSSIGSVLDDADREVSSLTDRAFRSLCISEDTSFSDSDLALSPDISRQVFGNFHQGAVSHTHRKSGIWSQLPSQGTEHAGWAATFQQLPKYVQGEEKYPKSSPPLTPAQRRLEVPVSGLRNSNKPISKVSSLIKSFDRTENQQCDSRPPTNKPPAIKNPPQFAPLPESGVNFCFDSAFLTVRRVPAEVSSTHQNSHQASRKHGEQESSKSPEMACQGSSSFLPTPENVATSLESKFPPPSHKPAMVEPGRSKEWARKGTFLHSENSAFESWSTHQPRLLERKDPAEAVPENKSPKHYEDTPLLREPQAPEHKVSPCQVQASCGQEENSLTAAALSTSGPWRARGPGVQVFPMEEKASSSKPDLQVKSTQPPWRKPKTRKGGKESTQDALEEKQSNRRGSALYSKHNLQGQFPENDALDNAVDPNDCYNPPFNISELLTPIIPTKHVLDSSNSPPVEITPLPPGQLNGYQEKESSECSSRDSYKSKAPSLLFNLKDVRKCVKSIYSPSPLLKGLDEKTRDKQEPMINGILPNGLEESPQKELSKERPADLPSLSHISTKKDPKADPGATSAENYLTLTSPPAIAKAPFCVSGEAANQDSYEKDATKEDSDLGAARSSWCPDSREHCPRKHLSLKLCSREPEVGRAEEQLKIPNLESGFSRSVSQETEPEREAGLQNPNFSQKFSPGPLSPEEEDVFYSDSQSDFMPGLKSKAKFSTSSSDQSFASFEDQQKTWFTESQWEDRKNDVSTGDSQKDEKEKVLGKDELQYCALSNGHTCMEEQSKGGILQGEGESVSGGKPRKPLREEASFRGTWIGGSKDAVFSHAQGITPSPSSTSNKHILFAIKDNTLRTTPVIKPIMLPLLRALSSEDPLGSGHKEEELPRPDLGNDASLCAPKSQEMPNTPTSTGVKGPHIKNVAYKGTEEQGWESNVAKVETKGNVSSIPLAAEGGVLKSPPDATWKVVVNDGKSNSTDQEKLEAPRCIPMIALPESDIQDQSRPQQLRTSGEEQTQDFKGHFLSTPRAGPPGRKLATGEMATSPNTSSLEESSIYSPATSSVWDDASQGPSELGLMPGEPSRTSPWANRSPARAARREDLMHAFTWEASSDPQLEPSAEDLRTLSPRGSLLDMATSAAAFPEKAEPSAHLERVAAKPPAVPPKTEKALRRAKKLASKRRKTDQAQEMHGKPQEEKSCLEDSEHRPWSPGERLLPRFPAIRALPPPLHRHSVSTFSELVRRQTGETQSFMPLIPYPATQKVLQDPQSGEYFVFDLPLQVKIKTFYDPETGKYVKVPIPSSEEGSPEPPLPDMLAAPYMLYPGIRPLPTTALMPLRCSSQLSAPTFLKQSPGTTEAACPGSQNTHKADPQPTPGSQNTHKADPQPTPGSHDNPTKHTTGQAASEPPWIPGEEEVDAPSLDIISTNDLEDFATEGIS
ncbi:cardiac-enriched FHL2-interacting protein [Pteronotus mesoamericanus]|uniref:cardiac-enriched FHL2-interacting protein n=1 Tax=Pteronotus mesoamericanus TaxID=1884717 RepID=UPI0023ED94FD|nr:cardiac-enriched FHL2-interacting protein [Pteronotus parnellii mesoamericanus]XP_054428347.1 cardiac-enriched FHL2-interacting protein [Pteronotus parnellii mesoamericanus]XP_054428348.1 cardiac-enriched FHL2-interacting protein [Pteronotus parnellii mesoamericanus]XP_054428349.1 cardiac-enriched FHL2-interacting protein [Pteronotus parnellii mesoamericanus]XP_054428350.1 cardiac-enriched FHL2-interacting protein [Pteronotus parnellii mesoamericanus]